MEGQTVTIVMILSFRTDRSGQTVQTQIRLLISVDGDVTARRSKMHGEFVSLKQRPVTSRAVFYTINSAVARIFKAL